MAGFSGKFDSTRQDWPTPDDMYDALDKIYNFTFDLAASEVNTKCKMFFEESDDSLSQNWDSESCWLNPPYGGSGQNKLSRWIEKSCIESQKHSNRIVVLIPARTNTNWWHDSCMKAKEILFIKGRPKFGDAKHGLPQPLAIIIFEKTDHRVQLKTFDMKTLTVY